MKFSNFFVGDQEISNKFRACYTQSSPPSNTKGIMSGEFIINPLNTSPPLEHISTKGLYIFAAHDGPYTKMVGMQYGNGEPKRVDGRYIKSIVSLDRNSISDAWNNATGTNVSDHGYHLELTFDGKFINPNDCLTEAQNAGASVYSISNMNKNGLAQCKFGSNVEQDQSTLIAGVTEETCLNNEFNSTVYTLPTKKNSKEAGYLGKTYLGEQLTNDGKTIFYEYPESMLSLGTQYNKVENYDSKGNDSFQVEKSNVNDCQQYCINRGDDCKGFVFDKNYGTCYFKNKIYPESQKQYNDSLDTYTRLPSINNNSSCSSDVKPVSANFLTDNGLVSNEQMNLNKNCDSVENLIKEVDNIESSYKTLSKEVDSLKKENNRISDAYKEVRHEFRDKIHDFDKTNEKTKAIMNNPTPSKALEDIFLLQKSNSMHLVGFILLSIIALIILLRVFRK